MAGIYPIAGGSKRPRKPTELTFGARIERLMRDANKPVVSNDSRETSSLGVFDGLRRERRASG